jgi:hypothetical protein
MTNIETVLDNYIYFYLYYDLTIFNYYLCFVKFSRNYKRVCYRAFYFASSNFYINYDVLVLSVTRDLANSNYKLRDEIVYFL